jgi:prepilin-type N-terminal cleavage/methylation domain-containing protein
MNLCSKEQTMFKRASNSGTRQGGFTLIEAMVAMAVLSFGLLAVASFQTKLVAQSGHSKARSEAIALAQFKLDQLRSYSTEHGLASNLTNVAVTIPPTYPALGAELVYPASVPTGVTTYAAEAIAGTNADFSRVLQVTRPVTSLTTDSDSPVSTVAVTVSWVDRAGVTQQVSLNTQLSWHNPRGTADLGDMAEPLVESATGRAYLGDGTLGTEDMAAVKAKAGANNNDGTYSDDHDGDGDLELIVENADGTAEVVLTLPDACNLEDPCSDFVKISGTVYIDQTLAAAKSAANLFVIASDAAYCSRWVPTANPLDLAGTKLHTTNNLTVLPGTDGDVYTNGDKIADFKGNNNGFNDYKYFNYTCYLGGGWYGNIGLLLNNSANSNDISCIGDAYASGADVSWSRVQLATRRVYRGMKHKYTTVGGVHSEVTNGTSTIFYSNGIKDAALLPDNNWTGHTKGHDYVVSSKNGATVADCDAILKRPDTTSSQPVTFPNKLFTDVPDDFICLNLDYDNSHPTPYELFTGYPWIYLDPFKIAEFDARIDCPFDPSSPPAQRFTISGGVAVEATNPATWGSDDPANGSYDMNINTTDGFGTCTFQPIMSGLLVGLPATYNYLPYTCDFYYWSNARDINVVISSTSATETQCAPWPTTNYVSELVLPLTGLSADASAPAVGCKLLVSRTITGTFAAAVGSGIDLNTIKVQSSFNNGTACPTDAVAGSYTCTVADAGTGWSGTVGISSSNAGVICTPASQSVTIPSTDTTSVALPAVCSPTARIHGWIASTTETITTSTPGVTCSQQLIGTNTYFSCNSAALAVGATMNITLGGLTTTKLCVAQGTISVTAGTPVIYHGYWGANSGKCAEALAALPPLP